MGRMINSTYLTLDGVVHQPEGWTFDYRREDAEAIAARVCRVGWSCPIQLRVANIRVADLRLAE